MFLDTVYIYKYIHAISIPLLTMQYDDMMVCNRHMTKSTRGMMKLMFFAMTFWMGKLPL